MSLYDNIFSFAKEIIFVGLSVCICEKKKVGRFLVVIWCLLWILDSTVVHSILNHFVYKRTDPKK